MRSRHLLAAWLICEAVWLIAGAAGAEAQRLGVPLARAGAALELNDGRVLLSGRGPRTQLLVADFAAGTAVPVDLPPMLGGKNALLLLWGVGGDSVVAWDAGSQEGVWLDGARVLGAAPRALAGHDLAGVARGGLTLSATRPDSSPAPDSSDVILLSGSGQLLRKIRLLRANQTIARDTATVPRPIRDRVTIDVRGAREQAALFPDGWIAVARVGPYRVDLIGADGHVVTGRSLGDPCGYAPGPRDQPAPFVGTSPILGAPAPALIPLADGRLLIRRTPAPGQDSVAYDIVDRRGACAGRIMTPPGQSIVGAGRNGVYVIENGDGNLYLRRVAVP